jgi:hypothetical protein
MDSMRDIARIGWRLPLFAASMRGEPEGGRDFTAGLRDCTGLIGFGSAPLAVAAPLVPSNYTVVNIAGTAGLVVRASSCKQVGMDGSAGEPVFVSQIGIAILTPDGTGNINHYQLLYVTNDENLADTLQRAGVPAQVDREFAYEFTHGMNNQPGEVYVAAGDPPSGAPVVANWWFNDGKRVVKLSTSIPSIAYRAANLVFHTSRMSPLGSLIGGNSDANFAFFSGRGVFGMGQFRVATK